MVRSTTRKSTSSRSGTTQRKKGTRTAMASGGQAAPPRRRVPLSAGAPHAAAPNRLSLALETVSLLNPRALDQVVSSAQLRGVELAPTFRQQFARHRVQAGKLAESFARSIKDPLHHRELFQQAATMSTDERVTLIAG